MEGSVADPENPAKKTSVFDGMDRDQLIVKCKNLLMIAKQAKQAKDEIGLENKKLKEEIDIISTQKLADKDCLKTMQEMVESLTENKLTSATTVDQLNKHIKKLEAKLLDQESSLSTENEGLKRQVQRLSDENDALLADLDNLERKQGNSGSLEEDLKNFQINNANLQSEVDRLSDEVKKINLCFEEKSQELKSLQIIQNDLSEKNSTKIKQFIQENSNLKKQIDQTDLQVRYDKLIRKLKLYREKVIEISGTVKALKNDREVLLVTAREYAETIPRWQKEILNASNIIFSKVLKYEADFKEMTEQMKVKNKEISDLREELERLRSFNSASSSFDMGNLESENKAQKEQINVLLKREEDLMAKSKDLQCEIDELVASKTTLETTNAELAEISVQNTQANVEVQNLESENKAQKEQINVLVKQEQEALTQLKALQIEIEDLIINKTSLGESLKGIENKNSELANKIEEVLKENEELKLKVISLTQESHNSLVKDQEIQDFQIKLEELQESNQKLLLFKSENFELIGELKEMNEIMKERGEVISKQSSKINELELQKKEFNENYQIHVQKLKEKDEKLEKLMGIEDANIKLLEEISGLKEKFNTSLELMDTMSSSTISKADEAHRFRELEDSFEEKYNKLKAFAVKMKKKIAEQQGQIRAEAGSADGSAQSRNMQALHQENDKLQDELEVLKKEKGANEIIVIELKEALSALQEEVDSHKNSNVKIQSESNSNKKDKKSYENAVKEYQNQLQSLKKEKEALSIAKMELENEVKDLKNSIKAKDKSLNDEMEVQKQLRTELDKTKIAVKKTNVLSLEMDAYEKSMVETNKKLEAKKVQVKELEVTIDAMNSTMNALKEQIVLLEQSLASESNHSKEIKQQLNMLQAKLRESEHDRTEANIQLGILTKNHETLKLDMDEVRLEMTTSVNEKEKLCAIMEADKDELLKKVNTLESDLDLARKNDKEHEREVEDLKTEFASYKIRAQSVLRQNQSKDTGKEQELMEDLQKLHDSMKIQSDKNKILEDQHESLLKSHNELAEDKKRLQNRCKDLLDLLEEARLQCEQVLEDAKERNREHQEAVKANQLQVETLNNCYKKQIEELIEKHSLEIVEFKEKEKIKKDSMPQQSYDHQMGRFNSREEKTDEQKIFCLIEQRQEGEGSENTSQTSSTYLQMRRKISASGSNRKRDLMPLDELLNSTFDDNYNSIPDEAMPPISPTQELEVTRDKLGKEESRVKHLTALLAEAEQDLAKLQQLNEMLKEEIRRQQRSIEREQHIYNSEYLKNVIIKFLTLNSGDEKTRLVPVINTILKLSPEENQLLQNAAKGASWGSMLWSGN